MFQLFDEFEFDCNYKIMKLTSSNRFATTSAPSRLSPFLKTRTRCFGFSSSDFIRFDIFAFFGCDFSSGNIIPLIVHDEDRRIFSLSVERKMDMMYWWCWLWMMMVDGWWWFLMMIDDYCWWWLIVFNDDRWWLITTADDWSRLLMIADDRWRLIKIDNDWSWLIENYKRFHWNLSQ